MNHWDDWKHLQTRWKNNCSRFSPRKRTRTPFSMLPVWPFWHVLTNSNWIEATIRNVYRKTPKLQEMWLFCRIVTCPTCWPMSLFRFFWGSSIRLHWHALPSKGARQQGEDAKVWKLLSEMRSLVEIEKALPKSFQQNRSDVSFFVDWFTEVWRINALQTNPYHPLAACNIRRTKNWPEPNTSLRTLHARLPFEQPFALQKISVFYILLLFMTNIEGSSLWTCK